MCDREGMAEVRCKIWGGGGIAHTGCIYTKMFPDPGLCSWLIEHPTLVLGSAFRESTVL